MIDLHLPEPPIRQCCVCLRDCETRDGTLIHWPAEDAPPEAVLMIGGFVIEPFSMWVYRCRFHRAVDTRRRKREEVAR
jgi:hypothetical protein